MRGMGEGNNTGNRGESNKGESVLQYMLGRDCTWRGEMRPILGALVQHGYTLDVEEIEFIASKHPQALRDILRLTPSLKTAQDFLDIVHNLSAGGGRSLLSELCRMNTVFMSTNDQHLNPSIQQLLLGNPTIWVDSLLPLCCERPFLLLHGDLPCPVTLFELLCHIAPRQFLSNLIKSLQSRDVA